MPTYEYKCNACKKRVEIFHSIKDEPRRKCPSCGKNALERLIGTGGAIIFKGSGFYQTDYRSEAYKKSAEADKPTEAKPSEAAASTDKADPAPPAKPDKKDSGSSPEPKPSREKPATPKSERKPESSEGAGKGKKSKGKA